MQVHHIGYLVADMDNALKEFLNLGYEIEQEVMHDHIRNINICFIRNNGFLVELISPCEGCKSFSALSKRIGNAPYHICYFPDEHTAFDSAIEALGKNDFLMVQAPEEAPALGGRRVAFMFNPEIGLIEILEAEIEAEILEKRVDKMKNRIIID